MSVFLLLQGNGIFYCALLSLADEQNFYINIHDELKAMWNKSKPERGAGLRLSLWPPQKMLIHIPWSYIHTKVVLKHWLSVKSISYRTRDFRSFTYRSLATHQQLTDAKAAWSNHSCPISVSKQWNCFNIWKGAEQMAPSPLFSLLLITQTVLKCSRIHFYCLVAFI